MSYEEARQQNIKRNNALLAELNLKHEALSKSATQSRSRARGAITKSKHVRHPPIRVSARLADESRSRISYNEDDIARNISVTATTRRGKAAKLKGRNQRKANVKVEAESEDGEPEVPTTDVSTTIAGWSEWIATAPPPTRDSKGTFHFEDEPIFLPNKSPAEVLREGAFGGGYFRPVRSRKLGLVVEDDWKELPPDWIEGLDVGTFLTSPIYNTEVNKFGVACGQSIEEWEAAGWIRHEHDVRGWFQWYTRYFRGRRCEDDERQISRWKKCVGETGRWRRMLLKTYGRAGVRTVFNDDEDEDAPEVSPAMSQTVHHWAWEVRQEVLDQFWANGGK